MTSKEVVDNLVSLDNRLRNLESVMCRLERKVNDHIAQLFDTVQILKRKMEAYAPLKASGYEE